jgi:hypothetical protein
MDVVTLATQCFDSSEAVPAMNIDVIGIGSSVYDSMKNLFPYDTNSVNFAERSDDRDKTGSFGFSNLRAEFYWKFREMLDPETSNVCLPPDPELEQELVAVKWKMTTTGVQLEPKDEIRKRLGRSPNKADAVVLAFCNPYPETVSVYHGTF